MKIGNKKFKQIDKDTIQIWQFSTRGLIFAIFFLTGALVTFPVIILSVFKALFNSSASISITLVASTISLCILIFVTHLFKQRIRLNRITKIIESAYPLFFISKKTNYLLLSINKRTVHYNSGGFSYETILSEEIIHPNSLKLKSKIFLKISNSDNNFIEELDAFMFQHDSSGNPVNLEKQFEQMEISDANDDLLKLKQANIYASQREWKNTELYALKLLSTMENRQNHCSKDFLIASEATELLGNIQIERKNYKRAIQYYELALQYVEEIASLQERFLSFHSNILSSLASSYFKVDMTEKARDLFIKANNKGFLFEDWYAQGAALCELKLGNSKAALKLLQDNFDETVCETSLIFAADIYRIENDSIKAEKILQQALEEDYIEEIDKEEYDLIKKHLKEIQSSSITREKLIKKMERELF